jgi:hypothetical protein
MTIYTQIVGNMLTFVDESGRQLTSGIRHPGVLCGRGLAKARAALELGGIGHRDLGSISRADARRTDHPISPATIRNMTDRLDISCQHALFLPRWLNVSPETFIAAPQPGTSGIPLPSADDTHRLRWNLSKLYSALDTAPGPLSP